MQHDGPRGPWMQTYSGQRFHYLDPHAEDVNVQDIAHHLAAENRFSGATREPYSVGQHSVLVARRVQRLLQRKDAPELKRGERTELELAALLHDAAEAYAKDIPRPLKKVLGEAYASIERKVEAAVAGRFELPVELFDHPLVKQADNDLLVTEKKRLMLPVAGVPDRDWLMGLQGTELTGPEFDVTPWDAFETERQFLRAYDRLLLQRIKDGRLNRKGVTAR